MPRDQTVWFAMIDGREAGPMTRGEFALRMANDVVSEETFVWREGMSEWLPASDVRELAPMFQEKIKARQRSVRPPPPPAAALKKTPAPVEEEIELDVAPPVASTPPPRVVVPDPPPAPIQAAPPVLTDEDDDSTVAEMLPLGERVHQEEVAAELFTTGETSTSGRTGAFAIDEVRWAYAKTQKPPPKDAKAEALARAIQATSVKPAPGAPVETRHPVTPAHVRTPSAGPRPRKAAPEVRKAWSTRVPVAVLIGLGGGIFFAAIASFVIWLLR